MLGGGERESEGKRKEAGKGSEKEEGEKEKGTARGGEREGERERISGEFLFHLHFLNFSRKKSICIPMPLV